MTANSSGLNSLLSLKNGLVGYWKLRGDCRDYSGQENHGMVRGEGPAFGKFDGESGFIEVKNSASMNFGDNDFTVSAEVFRKGNGASAGGDILCKFDATHRNGFSLCLGTSAGGYNSQGNEQQIHFGIDDSITADWEDCGRPNESSNFAGSLTVYDGALYVGTNDAQDESDWCHVFRYKEGSDWEDCGRVGNRRTHGIEAMITHEGALYAGTSNYDKGGEVSRTGLDYGRIYRYQGGQEWEDCGQPGKCGRLPCLASYKGRLYVLGANDESTPDRKSRCYVYEGDKSWKMCGQWITNVHCMMVHRGKLHVGGNGAKYWPDAWLDGFPGAEVYTYDGKDWESLGNPLGSWEKCNQVHTMGVHRGELIAGTWPDPVAVSRNSEWKHGGFLGDSIETNDLAVYNGKLYAGTIPRGDVWRYEENQSWTLMKRFYSPEGWNPVEQRKSGGDYREMKKAWTRVTSLTVFGGRLFASIGSCTGSIHHVPADVRGRVFSFQAGKSVTMDRDVGNGWKHWAAVKKRGRLKLYLNGKPVASSSPFQSEKFNLSNDASLQIGFGESGYFSGKIREIRLYQRALQSEELKRWPRCYSTNKPPA